MHDRKFSPERAARLDRPERYKETDFQGLISQLELEGQTVADIGAGTGFFTIPFSLEAGEVLAIDISPEMLAILEQKLANEKIANVRTVLSSEDSIGLPDASVDIAWMNNVLHELEGPGTVKEIRRILRPGGRLAIQDFHRIEEEDGPPLEHRMDRSEAISTLEEIGFRHQGDFETGTARKYGLIFTR